MEYISWRNVSWNAYRNTATCPTIFLSFFFISNPGLLCTHTRGLLVFTHTILDRQVWVMSLKVLHNLKFLFGSICTVEAIKWQLIGVGQVMMAETRRPPERPLAYGAHIRSLLTVFSLVCFEEEARLESLSAFLTYKGTHVSVACLPVDAQCIGTVGAVLTVLTCVRFSACWKVG